MERPVSPLSLPLEELISSMTFALLSSLTSSSLSYLFLAELKTNCCFPKAIGSFGFKAL